MDLKQKKTIFWCVVITLLISILLLIWFNDFEDIFKKGIWNGLGLSVFLSLSLLSLPSVIFYRLLIGKIPLNTNYQGVDFYIIFIVLLGGISFVILDSWFSDFLRNPPKWILPISLVIILFYGIHKILKRFIFEFKKDDGEKENL